MTKYEPSIDPEALAEPRQPVVRDLSGIGFSTLTTLLDVPFTNGTRKAAS